MVTSPDAPPSIAIDSAGAVMGGAARYLRELDAFLVRHPQPDSTVMGRGRRLSPRWLAAREIAAHRAPLRIALNNVSFVGGARRVTLLGNALHFTDSRELRALQFPLPPTLALQARIARVAGSKSDVLIAPSEAMAERVRRHAPQLSSRVVVRHHPVSRAPWAGVAASCEANILVPVINAPYKRLDWHLTRLLKALDQIDSAVSVVATAVASDFSPGVAEDPRVRFIGPVDGLSLEQFWSSCSAIYFPTQFESFGYPLAEARVNGVPVIGLESAQNREIAGAALRAFELDDLDSLSTAIERALAQRPEPDDSTCNPDRYFEWLLSGAGE